MPDWFGLPAPDAAPVAWGARAIFQSDWRGGITVDIVWDRQQFRGEPADCKALEDALNRYLLPEVRYRAGKELDPTTYGVVEVRAHGWYIQACPNASYGYLYMVAHPDGPTVPPPAPPGKWTPPKAKKTSPTRRRMVGYGR